MIRKRRSRCRIASWCCERASSSRAGVPSMCTGRRAISSSRAFSGRPMACAAARRGAGRHLAGAAGGDRDRARRGRAGRRLRGGGDRGALPRRHRGSRGAPRHRGRAPGPEDPARLPRRAAERADLGAVGRARRGALAGRDGPHVTTARAWVLLLPPTLFLVVGFAGPIVFLGWTSLSVKDGGFGLEQYRRFLLDPFYRGFLTETVVISLVTTAVCVVLAYPLAYQLARTGARARSVLLMLLIAPLMIGDVVRGYGWLIALGDYGVLNQLLLSARPGAKAIRLIFTPTGVVIGLVQVLLPFMVLPLAAAIGAIPVDLEEAALSLGARQGRIFRKVLLPLTRPGLAAGVVIVFALAMGSFAIPMFL